MTTGFLEHSINPSHRSLTIFPPCNTSRALILLRQHLANASGPNSISGTGTLLSTHLDAIDTVSRLLDIFKPAVSNADHQAPLNPEQTVTRMLELRLNVQREAHAAEIAILRHKLMLAEAELLKLRGAGDVGSGGSGGSGSGGSSGSGVIVVEPPSTTAAPNGKVIPRDSLSSLALPLNQLDFRLVNNLPNIVQFETPKVGAWDWVTSAEGELVITKVITQLLYQYRGSEFCGASSLFLDVGANSGY
jgi:hypothetical protein